MRKILIIHLALSLSLLTFSQEKEWLTHYEKSNFRETPRYEATIDYCKKLASHSDWINYQTFGKSPQNRDLPVLIVDKNGFSDPEKIKNTGNTLLLIEACIHPGESEGKDAGLMLLRDIAIHKKYADLLDKVSILFIPIFNVDGHERFGPYNRINQNGPKEMGWRTNAQNLNLNRDFLKADAPEMRHWLKFFNRWLPDFFIDIHTTNGADYQYVITYAMETYGNMESQLTDWQKNSYLPRLKSEMREAGYPMFRYISFKDWHNPTSGMVAWAADPRLSQGYTAIRNRPGLLVETHMLKDYKTRVSGTYELLVLTLDYLNKESENLQKLVEQADRYTSSEDFRRKPYPVEFSTTQDTTMVDFEGFEYEVKESDLTGASWFVYSDNPSTFQVPYFNQMEATQKVKLPEFYIIPAEWTKVINRIELHGINVQYLEQEKEIKVETYKFSQVRWNSSPYEGRQRIRNFQIHPIERYVRFAPGSAVIDMAQPHAKVIAHILEPAAPDSYLKWGFFNAIFEQKEYAEIYVMEKKAREMLKNDPELKKEFEEKMKNDSIFAKNPWAISNWFYQRTPYWDEQKDVYPVGKIYNREALKELKLGI